MAIIIARYVAGVVFKAALHVAARLMFYGVVFFLFRSLGLEKTVSLGFTLKVLVFAVGTAWAIRWPSAAS